MCAGQLTKGIQQLVHAQVRRKKKKVVLHFATDPKILQFTVGFKKKSLFLFKK